VPEYPVSEKVLLPEDLNSADEVFITSTTRDILTVDSIDGRRIANRGRARDVLGAAFSAYVRRYVETHRAPVASR
jgi:branched-chain amino acid aminotransferase